MLSATILHSTSRVKISIILCDFPVICQKNLLQTQIKLMTVPSRTARFLQVSEYVGIYWSTKLTLILPFATIVALGGVCQLKSLSYLQYTTCNHTEQVFSCRSEPTFIQTRHFSLDSQVLDFTHTKKDREYQISSCH